MSIPTALVLGLLFPGLFLEQGLDVEDLMEPQKEQVITPIIIKTVPVHYLKGIKTNWTLTENHQYRFGLTAKCRKGDCAPVVSFQIRTR